MRRWLRPVVAVAVLSTLGVGIFQPWQRRTPRGSLRRHHVHATHEAPVESAPIPQPARAALRVTFLDVGQGDGALLESRDGHAAMIDAGPAEAEEHVANVLRAHGIRRLDWIVLTHPHLDHVGGAARLADVVAIGREYDTEYPHTIRAMTGFLARLTDLGGVHARARRNEVLTLGPEVRVALLAPHLPFLEHTRSGPNANSIIARVTVGVRHVLFEADAEQPTEARLLTENTPGDLAADIVKVAHHGSRYASTAPFFDAVRPRWAVISCGRVNDYGHPHLETLLALRQRGITVWRTDLDGDVTATIGDTVTWATAHPSPDADRWAPGVHALPAPN